MSRDESLDNGVPNHLRGQDLALHTIHSRTALRRDLRRWLRDAPEYYYSALNAAEGVARRVGKPPLVTISQDQLDEKVAEAAIEIARIADAAKRSRFRKQLDEAKNAWKEDPVNNPGPDEDFGVTVELDNPASVTITGTGSEDGDQLAWVAALKLAGAYRGAFADQEARKNDRNNFERKLELIEKIKAVNSGKSATPLRLPGRRVIWPGGIPAKAKRKRNGKRSTSRTVATHSSSSTATTDTLPQRWRDLSIEQKCGVMAQSIESEGRGLSITIQLDQEVVEAAQSAQKGVASHLRDRLGKVLKRSLGRVPDLLIIAEQGYGQKPHLHGVIDLEDTPENRKAVRHAGEVLSGLPLEGPGRARIVDIQRLENGGFWPGNYTKKFRHSTRKQMKIERVMAHTRNLGRRAMVRHEQTD